MKKTNNFADRKREEGSIIIQALGRLIVATIGLTVAYFLFIYIYASVGYYKAYVKDILFNFKGWSVMAFHALANVMWAMKNFATIIMNQFVDQYETFVKSMLFGGKEPFPVAWDAAISLAMWYLVPSVTACFIAIPGAWMAVTVFEWVGGPVVSKWLMSWVASI